MDYGPSVAVMSGAQRRRRRHELHVELARIDEELWAMSLVELVMDDGPHPAVVRLKTERDVLGHELRRLVLEEDRR